MASIVIVVDGELYDVDRELGEKFRDAREEHERLKNRVKDRGRRTDI